MTKNNKPILSILIDDDKRVKFADLARRNSLSMSYLVNQAIDRMLETDSIDIHRDSIVTSVNSKYVDSSVVGMTRTDIEELIKSSIVATDIERLVKSYVDSHSSSVVATDVPTIETIKAEIEHSIAPIKYSMAELETYTCSQFETVREELKALNESAVVPTTDSFVPTQSINQSNAHRKSINRLIDPNRRTWGQFFEMVGMTAMTAGEAQKKENAPLRDKQIIEGIAQAQEMGFGVWTAPRPGREFIKVEDKVNPPSLPLFTNE